MKKRTRGWLRAARGRALLEELDSGPARRAHQITLRRKEPADLHRAADRRFLGRAIGHLNAQEFEDAWNRGIVRKLVPDRLVTPLTP